MKLSNMSDLKKRFFLSISALTAVALLVGFSQVFLVEAVITLCIAAVVGIGVWEYSCLATAKKIHLHTSTMIAIAVTIVVAFFLTTKDLTAQLLPLGVLGIGFVVLFLKRFRHIPNALVSIAVEFFGVCYLAVPLSMMLGILYPHPLAGYEQEGRFWFLYLLAVTKIADVAGYFIGRMFGKRPLAPELSPKKTIEGSIAGFFASVAMSIGMQVIGNIWLSGRFGLGMTGAILLGALIGIFSQLGDLGESLLKRDAAVKDSNTLPGLGGILDMVDSLLFTSPIVYFFLNMW